MREMQQRVFAKRDAKHLLVKAPPASGKSRALMFVALDKLYNQGRKKVIVAVPERSIGASFASTNLTEFGFFADWEIKDAHNLCDAGSSAGKVDAFIAFLNDPTAATLVCTHATLRFAFEKLAPEAFNGTVLAIDEFHHVSADIESSRLGALLRDVMNGSDVHIVAMTGSYFRGDSVPVLSPEDEAKFTPVTFNYYDQLNGYEYLRSLGIGHHFYQGRYTDAIGEVLDLDKKTIVHIPNVNSGESTKDKLEEVGFILDVIGHVEQTDPDTGIISVRRKDNGEIVRVADLVDDTDQKKRGDTLHYLAHTASKDRDAVDIIIALGMAKEGFDWPFAEHALTVGYRASLTEVIQIIGRVTRDSPGKSHAQFTNLIAEP
ncbi:MAG TPA: DEAD/DEAH box helicase, partial [Gemmatimonadaceae bacterium]|nr:DEAD/DEAH box helicase [Gemmatimonadaceae bacterium]